MPNETVTPADVAGLIHNMRNWEGDEELDPADLIDEAVTALETLSAENERMRKALKALDRMNRGLDWCDQDEQARRWSAARRAIGRIAALEAQLAARTGAVKVKPLEWEERVGVDGTFDAYTSIGHYIATITDDDRGMWFVVGLTRSNYCAPYIDIVKAAAQADYERRILSALETAEPATDAEPERKWPAFVYDSEAEPNMRPHPTPSEARLREAVERYESTANHVGGCGDGNCVVVRPIGQHTNGGCRCYTDKMKAQRMMRAGQMLFTAIRAALKEASDERS